MQSTWIAVAGAFLVASYVKGTTGMGFPLIATPMVALLVDIRTTYALLLLPNILITVPERAILLVLAAMILLFLASSRMRVGLRVSPGCEPWLGPLTGLVGGVLNGVTNVFSPIATIYLLALQFEKRNFVKAMASIFLVAKLSQLAAISRWGLYTPAVLRWSVTLTGVALAAFWVGLKTQDRVRQETFTRLLRCLLAAMALFFIYRGLFGGNSSH